MVIKGKFSEKYPEKFTYSFNVTKAKESISILVKDCLFEHILVIVEDSLGKIRGRFTLKTYQRIYSIFKDEKRTSNLCFSGDIPHGEWKITFLKNYDCSGDFELEIIEDYRYYSFNELLPNIKEKSITKKWLSGELHCHSNYSDGKISFVELYRGYKEKSLDYLFLTDHNVISNKILNGDWNIFSGTELTLDDNGHFNIFGIKEIEYEKLFSINNSSVKNIENVLDKVKEKENSLICLNHPFQKNTGLQNNLSLDYFNTIEIINAPYKEPYENILKSINTFNYLWENGYKIFAVCGSDTHKEISGYSTTVGIPKNFTYIENELTELNLIDSLKKGKNYISFRDEIEINIFSENNRYLIGDEIKEKVRYIIKTNDKNITWKGKLNGKIIFEEQKNNLDFDIKLNSGEYFWLEGYDEKNMLVFFINPIFNNVIKTKELYWFEIIKYLKEGGK